MRHARIPSTLLLIAGIAFVPAAADDWPQWRGPKRDGRSQETGLIKTWPEGGPALAWKAGGLGTGYSSVSVSDGRIYTMGDIEGSQYVIALGAGDGKILWKTRVGKAHEDTYPGPRSTPTIDGDRVFAESTEGDVVSLVAATGEVKWSRNLKKDFGGRQMQAGGKMDWKFSESPLVDGDRVIVTPGGEAALMVALKRGTGEEVWRTPGKLGGERGADGAAYCSPVAATLAGTRQYVQLVGRGLVGVDADSGKLLWSYNRVANDVANISTPLIMGDHIFASTGYGTGAGLIRIRRDEQGFHADEVYFLEADAIQNHHGGLILHEGTVFTGTGHNKGFPIAVDFMTGKVAWGPERNAGSSSAAITYADGRLYFRYQDGRMILVEATKEAYRERGSFMIPDVQKESWAHPVVTGGKLLLREQDTLYVYDLKPTAPPPQPAGP